MGGRIQLPLKQLSGFKVSGCDYREICDVHEYGCEGVLNMVIRFCKPCIYTIWKKILYLSTQFFFDILARYLAVAEMCNLYGNLGMCTIRID